MGANDESGKWLQSALKNRRQNKLLRKLFRINPGFSPKVFCFLTILIFTENKQLVSGDFN